MYVRMYVYAFMYVCMYIYACMYVWHPVSSLFTEMPGTHKKKIWAQATQDVFTVWQSACAL